MDQEKCTLENEGGDRITTFVSDSARWIAQGYKAVKGGKPKAKKSKGAK